LWICYVLARMMIEPTFGRFFGVEPLRAVMALGAILLCPPMILFGAGSVVWAAWRKVRPPPKVDVSVRVTPFFRRADGRGDGLR
jgi:prolipoprotein diacylglyceryltransferase